MMVSTALTGNINCLGRQGPFLALKPAPGGYLFFKKPPINQKQRHVNANSKIEPSHFTRLVVFLTGIKNLKLTSFLIRTFLKYEIGHLPSDDVVGCQYAMTLSFFQYLPKPSSMYRLAMSRYKVTKNHFSMLIFCQSMYFFKRLC